MCRWFASIFIGLAVWASMETPGAQAAERFPPPEFETPHAIPPTKLTPVRAMALEFVDGAVLLGALVLAAYLVHRRRSRWGVAALTVFSLAYFGFYREGCVCPVGATQNVILAIFDPQYAIPRAVLVFFFLPLVFALFFGRTFCAAVCPLGAVQDLVTLRPAKLPRWLESALGVVPYVYLGLAVLLAATGAAFAICRFDPFVSFFRLEGPFNMLVYGGGLLLIGVFVGRPYCRFLCPYGVLLSLASRLSWKRVTITPDTCVKCRLCEDSCPFGAIRLPTPERALADRAAARRRLAGLVIAAPVIVGLFAWLGARLGPALAPIHPTVALAESVRAEAAQPSKIIPEEVEAFRRTSRTPEELYAEAQAIRDRFNSGAPWFGAWVGLAIALGLIGLSVRPPRSDFEADRAACVACARCFEYCPQDRELARRVRMEV